MNHTKINASAYDYEQLANIYNESRLDYIVPMPMNAKRLAEYVHQYDVSLEHSLVALNQAAQIAGIGMLGVRGKRGWITRLGVIPSRRGVGLGQYMVDTLLENAANQGAERVQLEVIEGNEPAYCMFQKVGFEDTRKLLVIRRPPKMPAPLPYEVESSNLTSEEIEACLEKHNSHASWLDEKPSILRGGNVEGVRVTLPSGESGTAVFRNSIFQLSHLALDADVSEELAVALLSTVHGRYPKRDTKLENLPAQSPLWRAFQQVGYVETFARIEMHKQF